MNDRSIQERRIVEGRNQIAALRAVNAHSTEFASWHARIKQALTESFGPEHSYTTRFCDFSFWLLRVSVGQGGPAWVRGDEERYQADLSLADSLLEEAIEELQEDDAVQTGDAFSVWNIIHPAVIRVSLTRFQSGQFADSVEAALREINARVKTFMQASGLPEEDGTRLMRSAFNSDSPVIRLADLSGQSGRDIQEGYGHIFAGAMLGIRNPKAHANLTITAERAVHLLILASLLMHKLDEAGVPA